MKFIFLGLLMMVIVISACDVYDIPYVKQAKVESQTIDRGEDIPSEIETALPETKEAAPKKSIEDAEKKIDQLHWTHMPVTYNIHNSAHMLKDCGRYESNKIRRAFDRIENATNRIVNFKEVDNQKEADIVLTCSLIEDCYKTKTDISGNWVTITETICEHTKGHANITDTEGYKILKARVEIIGLAGFAETKHKGPSGFYFGSCGHPTTEIHEILHAFGYDHTNDPDSIMYTRTDLVGSTRFSKGKCVGTDKQIDDWIVKDLIETYKGSKSSES